MGSASWTSPGGAALEPQGTMPLNDLLWSLVPPSLPGKVFFSHDLYDVVYSRGVTGIFFRGVGMVTFPDFSQRDLSFDPIDQQNFQWFPIFLLPFSIFPHFLLYLQFFTFFPCLVYMD